MLVSPRDQRNITFNFFKAKYTKLKFDCNVQHLMCIQGSETLLILIITIIIVMIMIIGAYVYFMALWKSNGKRTATLKARGHLHFFLQNSVNILNKLKCIRHLSLFYDQAEIYLSYSLHLYHAFDIAYPGSMWDACHIMI